MLAACALHADELAAAVEHRDRVSQQQHAVTVHVLLQIADQLGRHCAVLDEVAHRLATGHLR